jgi:hypothetical protein
VGVCVIKNPRDDYASDLADLGRSVLRPYMNVPKAFDFDGDDSQFELHAVEGDFEAGVDDGAMFGGAFVEDWICVVDVD